jgi:hypothetical protein
LLARREFLLRLDTEIARRAESQPLQWAGETLLARAPLTPAAGGATPAERLESVLLDPVYQLK